MESSEVTGDNDMESSAIEEEDKEEVKVLTDK